jgi:predicted regulator of Ras-like GTPase activity (Roadblock/LC7/MglB family)
MSPVPGKLPMPRGALTPSERQAVDKFLADYLKTSSATYVLLVDRDGQLLASQGDIQGIDTMMVSALCAGTYEVSVQMARALKKDAFTSIYQEGPRDNVHVSLVGEDAVLGVVFDTRTTLGMVRLYAKSLTQQLQTRVDRFAPRSRI